MHDLSEQEEKMREWFLRRNDNNLRHTNDNRTNKSQRDYSGPSRKRKPDDLVTAVDRPSRGRKTTTQEEFEKLLQKKCPWHPGANHAEIDCYHLRRTLAIPVATRRTSQRIKSSKRTTKGTNRTTRSSKMPPKPSTSSSKVMKRSVPGGNRNCFSEKSCPSSRRYHDHSGGRRSPSRSHEMINGPAFRSPANSP
jgi:hypothetical protein